MNGTVAELYSGIVFNRIIKGDMQMNNLTKIVLAAIPLIASMAVPAAGAMSDESATGGGSRHDGSDAIIESLLDRYAGLAPGDAESLIQEPLTAAKTGQTSAFTNAGGPMTSYFTAMGGAGVATSQFGSVKGSTDNAAAPAVAAITLARYAPDTLVGAVASGSEPSSSGSNSSQQAVPRLITTNPGVDQVNPTNFSTNQNQITTTIEPIYQITTTIEPIATPIPPAAALIGSGLSALGLLRKRKQGTVI